MYFNLKSSCNCSAGFAQKAETTGDQQSTQCSVDVKQIIRTEVISGPSLLELQRGPSSQDRVVNKIFRSRSQSVPCNFLQRSSLPLARCCSSTSTSQVDLSPPSTFKSIQYQYGEEFETDISVCDTSISISTDDSTATINSENTQISEPTTTDGNDDVSYSSKPDHFFDEDVIFPPVPSIVEGLIDCSLIEEVGWEDWAKRRIVKMVEKEAVVKSQVVDTECDGIPLAVRHNIINWSFDFEHRIQDYPSIPLPTRHRAIILFHQFCALDTMYNIDADRIKLRGHRIGVACLTLACKVDIDFLAPLEVIPLLLWEWSVVGSGWVDIRAEQIGMFEQIILETLDYQVTFPTPYDFLTEVVIAIPMLANLGNHCLEDWELIEEAFSLIYEHAYHHPEYRHHRSSVLTVAILLFCLDECIFDHPGSKTENLGQIWWRDTDGNWTEGRVRDSLEPVSCHLASEKVKGDWVNISEEVIRTSICEIMGLKESEVDECKRWCSAL